MTGLEAPLVCKLASINMSWLKWADCDLRGLPWKTPKCHFALRWQADVAMRVIKNVGFSPGKNGCPAGLRGHHGQKWQVIPQMRCLQFGGSSSLFLLPLLLLLQHFPGACLKLVLPHFCQQSCCFLAKGTLAITAVKMLPWKWFGRSNDKSVLNVFQVY